MKSLLVCCAVLGLGVYPAKMDHFEDPNPTGVGTTAAVGGIDPSSPFFQSIGTNGRSCASCHVRETGWSLSPRELQARFEASEGLDPVFRPVDGANSPEADVSTLEARRAAYSELLYRGVIRVGIPMPEGADFELQEINDPYGHAHAGDLSLFRRPLPAANLTFLSAVMWDGRESEGRATIREALEHQANGATEGHAQSSRPLTPEEQKAIVDFETGLFFAQTQDAFAGSLTEEVGGGPLPLSALRFYPGMNDPFGKDPEGKPFDVVVFRIFQGWWQAQPSDPAGAMRQSIARGEALFNTKPFFIEGVGGFNDDPDGHPEVGGTCSSCHSVPNVGSHSRPRFMDLALQVPATGPRYTLRDKATGSVRITADPGRALITGRWKDINRFKVPSLRGIAARAPYFHDGSAETLEDVLAVYDTRFGIGFSGQEMIDLTNFLNSL
jgi:cytochrome c peroxidase